MIGFELAKAFRMMQQRIASRESRIMDLAYRDTLQPACRDEPSSTIASTLP